MYEYLEGVLLRGVGGRRVLGTPRVLPRELAVYDLRKLGEWEDAPVNEGDGVGVEDGMEEVEEEETTESEAGKGIRSTKKLGFEISEFAVDPGADLLLVVEVRLVCPGPQILVGC